MIFVVKNNRIIHDFDFYISILSFLKEKNINISKITLDKKIEVPKFRDEYLCVILEKYLFGKEKQEELEIFEDKLNASSSIECSVESHYMALAGEESRLNGGKLVEIANYRK